MNGLGFSISADSQPDTPEDWSCSDWKTWHQKLVQNYGVTQANQMWLHEWEKQSWWDFDVSSCKYNTDWANYFISHGIDMHSIFSTIFSGGGDIVENVLDTGNKAVDTVGNTLNVGKYLVPAALIGAVGLIGFIVYKNSGNAIEIAKNVTNINSGK